MDLDNSLEIFKKNVSIDNAIGLIGEYEDAKGLTESNPVKWKSYSHQVLVKSNSTFYKLYENDTDAAGPFTSIIREKLAKYYKNLGIEWNLTTFEMNGNLYDFEQREELRVATKEDLSFGDLLLSFSYILDDIEKELEFDKILLQLKRNELFNNLAALKLLRECTNKHDDYALFKGQVVLLDDAEFYIALTDKQGNQIKIKEPHQFPVKTSYGDFLFTNCDDLVFENNKTTLGLRQNYEDTYGWYLYKGNEEVPSNDLIAYNDKKDIVLSSEKNKTLANNRISSIEHNIEIVEKNNIDKFRDQFGIQKFNANKAKKEFNVDNVLHLSTITARTKNSRFINQEQKINLAEEQKKKSNLQQLHGLHNVLDSLHHFDSKKFSSISLDEEFLECNLRDPEINHSFFKVIEAICNLYSEKLIDSIWFSASLAKDDQQALYEMLNALEVSGLFSCSNNWYEGIHIATHWMTSELLSKENRLNWENHIKLITAYYPCANKETTITLTQGFCKLYLADKFFPQYFMDKFKTFIIYEPYNIFKSQSDVNQYEATDLPKNYYNDEFLTQSKKSFIKSSSTKGQILPDRQTFRKFLVKYAKDDSDTFDCLFNVKSKINDIPSHSNNLSDTSSISDNKNKGEKLTLDVSNIENDKCRIKSDNEKHTLAYAMYADCNDCMLCDLYQAWDSVYGSSLKEYRE